MKTKDFMITSTERSLIDFESRILHIVYGVTIFSIIFLFPSHRTELLLLIGAFSLVYGIIGKGTSKIREWLIISANFIVIKTRYENEIAIPVKNIKYIRLNKKEMEFGFGHYSNSYSIRWVKDSDMDKLKTVICELSKSSHFELIIVELSKGQNDLSFNYR